MRTSSRANRLGVCAAWSLAVAALTGIAPPPTGGVASDGPPTHVVLGVPEGTYAFEFHDGFNDNTIDPATFIEHEFGGMHVLETGPFHYLAFNRIWPGNFALSHASIEIWPWGADLRDDFRVRWDYHMALGPFWFSPAMSPTLKVFHGVALAVEGEWPTTFTGVMCGLMQDATGLRLVLMTCEDGVQTEVRSVAMPKRRGAVNIDWDVSADRLTVRRGLVSVHKTGLKAAWEAGGADFSVQPLAISFGAMSTDGLASLQGRIEDDRFDFGGSTLPRP